MRPAELHPGPPVAPREGPAARGLPLRARALRPDAHHGADLRHRHVRAELPDHLRADGQAGLPPRRQRLRPAVHRARRRGVLRAPSLATRRTKRPTVLFLLVAAAAFGVAEIVAGLMPTFALTAVLLVPTGLAMLSVTTARQLARPARGRADDARTGDGAVPRLLHGRHAARCPAHRLAGRGRRAALGPDRRRAGLRAERAGASAALRSRAGAAWHAGRGRRAGDAPARYAA